MKKLFLAILFVASIATGAWAQVSVGVITGKVVSRVGREPIEQATVKLLGTPTQTVITPTDGTFTFTDIPFGFATIEVEALGYQSLSVNVKVDMELKDINYISLAPDMQAANDFLLDDGNFTEFDSELENESQSTPVSLSASKDVGGTIDTAHTTRTNRGCVGSLLVAGSLVQTAPQRPSAVTAVCIGHLHAIEVDGLGVLVVTTGAETECAKLIASNVAEHIF